MITRIWAISQKTFILFFLSAVIVFAKVEKIDDEFDGTYYYQTDSAFIRDYKAYQMLEYRFRTTKVKDNHRIIIELNVVGTWHGSVHGEYLNSIGEFKYYNYYSYEFKEDNRIWYYSTKSKYGVRIDKYSWMLIWKIENGKYYKKLYDNRYDSWGEFTIEKISDTVIKIDGIELKRT